MPTAWRRAKLPTMIKWASSRASWTAFVLLALGCGGRAENQVSTSAGGGVAASGGSSVAVAGSSAAGADAGGGGSTGDAGAAGSECISNPCPTLRGDCPPGEHYEVPQYACCPICTRESTNDCAQGEINYGKFFQGQLESNNFCKTDSDCASGDEGNACNLGCGFAINASSAAYVQSALSEYASNNCSTCPPKIPPPCFAPRAACMQGLCVLTP